VPSVRFTIKSDKIVMKKIFNVLVLAFLFLSSVVFSQTNNFPLYSNGGYLGGTGDYTNITNAHLKLVASTGYVRVPHLSSDAAVSTVYNFQTGKNAYWGEPSDAGKYFFRGRDLIVSEGRIGIGSTVTSPGAKLEVNSSGTGGSTLLFGGVIGSKHNGHELNLVGGIPIDGAWTSQLGGHIRLGGSARGDINVNAIQFIQNGVERMRVNDGGNVGIGTINPGAKLEVHNGTPLATTAGSVQLLSRISGRGDNYFMNNLWLRRDANGFEWWTTTLHDGISIDGSFLTPGVDTRTWWERHPQSDKQAWGHANQTYMTLHAGNLGIGTASPDAKLAVKGTVHANEVKVDLNVPGPDYVFADNYQLPTLNELKTYIDQHKHLPEVPSSAAMEANGINLGEINMLLLKKVEELTLYVIELNRKLDSQNKLIIEQHDRITRLESKSH